MPIILGLRKARHKEDHKEETILDYILIIRLKNLKQQETFKVLSQTCASGITLNYTNSNSSVVGNSETSLKQTLLIKKQ